MGFKGVAKARILLVFSRARQHNLELTPACQKIFFAFCLTWGGVQIAKLVYSLP
jgi:hypothetical protein